MFDDRVYKRGALTLHALRLEVGRRAVLRAAAGWVAEHRGGVGHHRASSWRSRRSAPGPTCARCSARGCSTRSCRTCQPPADAAAGSGPDVPLGELELDRRQLRQVGGVAAQDLARGLEQGLDTGPRPPVAELADRRSVALDVDADRPGPAPRDDARGPRRTRGSRGAGRRRPRGDARGRSCRSAGRAGRRSTAPSSSRSTACSSRRSSSRVAHTGRPRLAQLGAEPAASVNRIASMPSCVRGVDVRLPVVDEDQAVSGRPRARRRSRRPGVRLGGPRCRRRRRRRAAPGTRTRRRVRVELVGPVGQAEERDAGGVQLADHLDGAGDLADQGRGEVRRGRPARARPSAGGCAVRRPRPRPRPARVGAVVPRHEVEVVRVQEPTCLDRADAGRDRGVRVPVDEDVAEVEDDALDGCVISPGLDTRVTASRAQPCRSLDRPEASASAPSSAHAQRSEAGTKSSVRGPV